VAHHPKVSPNELRFAYYFLRAMHGNVNNAYLLLAVVAWLRATTPRGQRWVGNNPLLMVSRTGALLRFSSIQAAAQAAANRMLAGRAALGYKPLIYRIREAVTSDADKKQQALDFVNRLALSYWDPLHYGLGWYAVFDTFDPTNSQQQALNRIFNIYVKLPGMRFTLPADLFPTPKVHEPKEPPKPKQPLSIRHVHVPPDYLLPYAAYHFLVDRQWTPETLPGDPVVK